jgi:hypothetical protein
MARLKQVSSFSEEKEAKRLSFVFVGFIRRDTRRKWIKVFWFFFSKKNVLSWVRQGWIASLRSQRRGGGLVIPRRRGGRPGLRR